MEPIIEANFKEIKKPQSLHDAIEILNKAAEDSAAEMRQILKESPRAIVARATRKIREKAQDIDQSIHEHPWLAMGGVALAMGLLGYVLGKRNEEWRS